MYVNDQRKPLTCNFNELVRGDLFAYEDGEDMFYLMVLDEDSCDYFPAVVLGVREGDTHLTGAIWKFEGNEEVQPLKGDLKVWAK